METQAMNNSTIYGTISRNASNCVISIVSDGYFKNDNPLFHSLPLFTLQSFLASLVACIISALLMPLGIPLMVTQILAGILFGPSILGQIANFIEAMFPQRSHVLLETYGKFGTLVHVFLIGVQMDPVMLSRPGRKALIIGICVVVVPFALVSICFLIISKTVAPEHQPHSFMLVGALESMSSFPVIAGFLIELNILNTECSNIAFCSSMVSGILCSLILFSIQLQRQLNEFTTMSVVVLFSAYALLFVAILFLARPIVNWMVRRAQDGRAMSQGHLHVVFVLVMMTGFLGKSVNFELLFGPFLLGVLIPSGPPLGSVLVEKFDFFNKWMIMPIFYTMHGARIDDIFTRPTTADLLVVLIVLISTMGKFLGAFLPALYFNMPYNDSCLLGLAMNAQGFIEIVLFETMSGLKFIDHASFNVMSLSMLILTGASAPLVRYLYKNSTKYILHNKRTIQHWKPDTELRVLGCVYDEENVPSMIHILKATNPTTETPIYLSIIHFVELVGRAAPLLISHRVHKQLPAAAAVSEHIVNVFKRYEENNKGGITIHPYTVVSHFPSMHNDVCMLALNKRTSLVILPYHKNLASGYIDSGIKKVNCDVLEKSPCSAAILIDRGILDGNRFVFTNWVTYHVAVVFLGGADDREALAHGKRMSGNPTIVLTVIRFLTTKGNDSDQIERRLDHAMASEFKFETTSNNRVTYMEKEVENGLGVIKVLELMADQYELIILGRRHDEKLQLIIDLTDWNKCSELGTVADIFTTSGYGGKATLLVVQQQSKLAALSQYYKDEESQATYDVER